MITHLFSIADLQLAVTARRAGIKVVGMPHSWDNLTSKSGVRQGTNPAVGRTVPIKFDRMIVWNDVLKDEAIRHYGYREDEVAVTGIPQFDIYKRAEKIIPRDEFIRRINGDPGRRLVVYAAGSPQYLHQQEEIVEIIIDILRSGRIEPKPQLLVRHHPNRMAIQSLSRLEVKYKNDPDILFFSPSSMYTALSDTPWNVEQGDEMDLAYTLNAADVIITMASTITLDACAFDKPIINIAFDGRRELPYFQSQRKIMDYTHYRKIIPSGAFRIARNGPELEAQIDAYLKNPRLDADGRKRLLRMVCGDFDGKAGARIAAALLSVAESAPTSG